MERHLTDQLRFNPLYSRTSFGSCFERAGIREMRGQPFQDLFEHFVSESRASMPDVTQFISIVDAEHQRSKMFSRTSGFCNASDHGLLL